MLVKLMYEDAECILNAEMHVNPEHIVSVRMRDDGRLALMQLDSADTILRPDGSIAAKTTFEVSPESYDRIVVWMEKHDG